MKRGRQEGEGLLSDGTQNELWYEKRYHEPKRKKINKAIRLKKSTELTNVAFGKGPEKVPREIVNVIGSFKKGGKVKRTGNYKLHKGEVVVPASRVKAS